MFHLPDWKVPRSFASKTRCIRIATEINENKRRAQRLKDTHHMGLKVQRRKYERKKERAFVFSMKSFDCKQTNVSFKPILHTLVIFLFFNKINRVTNCTVFYQGCAIVMEQNISSNGRNPFQPFIKELSFLFSE